MKARTLLTAALVAGVMACSGDPVGPTHGPRGFADRNPTPDPNLVSMTGEVMLKDGGVALQVFEGQWANQVLPLVGAPAEELRSHVGAIVRVTGTLLGTVLDIAGYDMIVDERGHVH